MSISSVRRGGKSLFALALATSMLALGATSANAANICVNVPAAECPVGATSYNTGTAALTSAINDSLVTPAVNDKIYVQSGSYAKANGWSLGTGNNVTLLGVGPTKPVLSALTPNPGDAALASSAGSVQISNIAVIAPAVSNSFGINTATGAPIITNVSVTGSGATYATGIKATGAGLEIDNVNIDLPFAPLNSPTGIDVSAASSPKITDTVISEAYTGIEFTNVNTAFVQRANIRAVEGATFNNSHGTISSSLLRIPASGTPGIGTIHAVLMDVTNGLDFTSTPVNVFNNTVIGNGDGSNGLRSRGTNAGSIAQITVDSTVITGFTDPFVANVFSGGDAYVNANYTRYSGLLGPAVVGPSTSVIGDPMFKNPAGGDYSLLPGSPLIDSGNPGTLANSSLTDLAGNPRVASRGGGNIRDVGAYEVPNSTPVANIAIATASPTTTEPTTFSGAGSSDSDGDALTYAWQFDNGTFASGAVAQRTIATSGPHSVTLTVTDVTGATNVVSQQFVVTNGTLSMTLNKKSLRATGKGDFSVKLTCPDAAPGNCSGKLLFKTTKKKVIKAAQYVFSMEPGTTRTLRVTTYKSFRKQLKKQKKVKLRMSMSAGSAGDATLVATATTFSLSAPK